MLHAGEHRQIPMVMGSTLKGRTLSTRDPCVALIEETKMVDVGGGRGEREAAGDSFIFARQASCSSSLGRQKWKEIKNGDERRCDAIAQR
ncbi:hypothetical protein LSTR_LSTR014832 [Laodelphax striatellus]|uniref:Uncharacterized protein n=1 Tax=Laodelphax striatellus TaxID=195883 RepID=A0A482WM95_LAOST|nr:hypothetical protein LSTR_LSTR014832 [Laodelphax striatellus]